MRHPGIVKAVSPDDVEQAERVGPPAVAEGSVGEELALLFPDAVLHRRWA